MDSKAHHGHSKSRTCKAPVLIVQLVKRPIDARMMSLPAIFFLQCNKFSQVLSVSLSPSHRLLISYGYLHQSLRSASHEWWISQQRNNQAWKWILPSLSPKCVLQCAASRRQQEDWQFSMQHGCTNNWAPIHQRHCWTNMHSDNQETGRPGRSADGSRDQEAWRVH